MTVIRFGQSSQFDLKVNKPNLVSAIARATFSSNSESLKVTTPLVWEGECDTYYEPVDEKYFRFVGSLNQIIADTSESHYKPYLTSQPDLTPHSGIKVANVLQDGTVKYYSVLLQKSATDFSKKYIPRPGYNLDSDPVMNSTSGYIAGTWQTITATSSTNNEFTLSTYTFATTSSIPTEETQKVTYTQSASSNTNHNLITGSKVLCVVSNNTTAVKINAVYFVIKVSNTVFRLAKSYAEALAGAALTVSSGVSITLERQAGWIKVEEGDTSRGNGGDPALGGTGNSWIRNPYNPVTKVKTILPTYNSNTAYKTGDRVLHNNEVWECLDNQNIDNAITPSSNQNVLADYSGEHGNVMLEIPEFFFRKDYFDGNSWFNIKGEDVSKDYTIVSSTPIFQNQFVNNKSVVPLNLNSVNGDVIAKLHVFWLITKQQLLSLSPEEQLKYVRHPAFMSTSDSEESRRIRLTAKEIGNLMPTGHPMFAMINWNGVQKDIDNSVVYLSNVSGVTNAIALHRLKAGKSVLYQGHHPGLIDNTIYYVFGPRNDGGFSLTTKKNDSSTALKQVYDEVRNGPSMFYYDAYLTPIITKSQVNIISCNNGVFTASQDHQFMEGQKVQLFFTGTLTNFTSGSNYYVLNPDYTTNTFQLCSSIINLTASLTPVFINNGSNTTLNSSYIQPIVYDEYNSELSITSVSNNKLYVDWQVGFSSHNFATGDSVVFTGNLNGLQSGKVYYVIRDSQAADRDNWLYLASSMTNASKNISLTVSGFDSSATLKRADYVDQELPGHPIGPIISIKPQSSINENRVRYKGLFLGGAKQYEATAVTVTGVAGQSVTVSIPMDGANNQAIKDNLFTYNNIYFYSSNTATINTLFNGGVSCSNLWGMTAYYPININQTSTTITFNLTIPEQNGLPSGVPVTSTQTFSTSGIKIFYRVPNSIKTEGFCASAGDGVRGISNNQITLKNSRLRAYYREYSSFYATGNQVSLAYAPFYKWNPGHIEFTFSNSVFTTSVGVLDYKNQTCVKLVASNGSFVEYSSQDYYVFDVNPSTKQFKLSTTPNSTTAITVLPTLASGATPFFISPKIFFELEPRLYYVRRIDNNTISLHTTYEGSLNNTNIVQITNQPQFVNSTLNWLKFKDSDNNPSNTASDLYGTFTHPQLGSSLEGAVPDGFSGGDLLLFNAIQHLINTEVRNVRECTSPSVGSRLPQLQKSSRVALHYLGDSQTNDTAQHWVNFNSFNNAFVPNTFNNNIVHNNRAYCKLKLRGEVYSIIFGTFRKRLNIGFYGAVGSTNSMTSFGFGVDEEDRINAVEKRYEGIWSYSYSSPVENAYSADSMSVWGAGIWDFLIISDSVRFYLHR